MKYWSEVDFTRFAESKSRRTHHHYSPFVAALDTETSTVPYDDTKKVSFMYVWQMAIEQMAFYGRTWDEFLHCLETMKEEMHLSSEYKLIVYVHKLKYDFSFYKKEVNLEGEFIARSPRTILKHMMQDCFEVRDSGAYTEQPLEAMGEEIGISKGKGYDYNKIRTFDTPLTAGELSYCENDVLILTKYFRREANYYKNVSQIPLTATQRVKRIINTEFNKPKNAMFRSMILSRQLQNNDVDNAVLALLKKAFFGAFNYSNGLYRGITVDSVTGVDLDTCYGAQCLFHQYPMTKFKSLPIPKSTKDLKTNPIYKGKAMLITFAAKGVKAKYGDLGFLPTHIKNYWERSATDVKNISAKRMLVAEKIRMTLTDVDFMLFLKLYNYDGIKFESVQGAEYGNLPDYMVETIVNMYTKKVETKRKHQEIKKHRPLTLAEQHEYTRIKTQVSRIYGILVQDPIRPVYGWDSAGQDVIKVRDSTSRVQFQPVLYQWGVWVVAWARFEIIKFLFSVAYKDGDMQVDKILYSDTDSLYFRGDNESLEAYNKFIDKKIKSFCTKYNKDYEILKDMGKLKSETYEKFKTTGLKQYAYIQNGMFDYRCSGLPRPDYEYTDDGKIKMNENGNPINHGMTFFDNFESNEERLAAFNNELSIPASEAHVKKNTYYDDGLSESILVTDYQGGMVRVHPQSWVVIEETGFDFDHDPFKSLENIDEDRFDFISQKLI